MRLQAGIRIEILPDFIDKDHANVLYLIVKIDAGDEICKGRL